MSKTLSRCPSLEIEQEDFTPRGKITPEIVSRGRTPTRSLKDYYDRTWTRRWSPGRGDYLKVEDEMTTVTRGSSKIQIVRKTSHNIPSVILGHLDQRGKDLLDNMLEGGKTIDEIIEYFKNYSVEDGRVFEPRFYRSNRSSRQSSMEPDEDSYNSSSETNLKSIPKKSFSKNNSSSRLLNVPEPHDGKCRNKQNIEDENKNDSRFNLNGNDNDNSTDLATDLTGYETNGNDNYSNMNDKYRDLVFGNGSNSSEEDNLVRNVDVGVSIKSTDFDSEDEKSKHSVFDIVEADNTAKMIPYMHPDTRKHTFQYFFDRVHQVCDPIIELAEEDVIDVMQFRMGGSYLTEIKDLRLEGSDRGEIEDYFLKKDLDAEGNLSGSQSESSEVEDNIWLRRLTLSQVWGVDISHSLTPHHGLLLLVSDVQHGGPAWQSGLRQGDAICQVNEWRTARMDRPEVALHLFQAGAHRVKLGIKRGEFSNKNWQGNLYNI